MKTIKLFPLFFLFAFKLYSQNAYYEALYFDALNLDDIKHNIVQSENMKERGLYSKMSSIERKKFDEVDEKTKEILLKEKYKKPEVLEKEIIEKIKTILNRMVKKGNFINLLFPNDSPKSLSDFNKLIDESILKDKATIKSKANSSASGGNISKSDASGIINTTSDLDITTITIISIEEFIKQDIDETNKAKINAALYDYNDLVIKQANEYFNDKTNFFTYLKQIIIIQGHQTKFSDEDYTVLKNLVDFKTDPFNNQKPDLSKLKIAFDKFNYSLTFKNAESATFFSLTNLLNPLGFLGALPNAQADTLLQGLAIYINEQVKRTHTETALGIIEKRFGRYHDFRLLFPKTYEKMISHDWTKMQDLGNEFKQVFKEDYKNFTTNFYTLIENPKKEDWSGKQFMVFDADLRAKIYQKPYYAWSKVYLDAGRQMIDGLHPIKVLQYIDEKYKNYTDSMYYQNDVIKNKISLLEKGNLNFEKDKVKLDTELKSASEDKKKSIEKEIERLKNKIDKNNSKIKELQETSGLINLTIFSGDTLIFGQDLTFKIKDKVSIDANKINKLIAKSNTSQPDWLKSVLNLNNNISINFKANGINTKANFIFTSKKTVTIKYLQETKVAITKGEVLKKVNDKLETQQDIRFQADDNSFPADEIILKEVAANTSLSLKDITQIEIPQKVEFSIDFGKENFSVIFMNPGEGDTIDYFSNATESIDYFKMGDKYYKLKETNNSKFIKFENKRPSDVNSINISSFFYKPKINENEIDPTIDIKLDKDKSYLFPKNLKLVSSDKEYLKTLITKLNENSTFHLGYNHKEEYHKLHDFFHTINFIQENIRDTSSKVVDRFSKVWLNFDQLKKLEQNPQRRMYFLALLKSADSTAFANLCSHAKIDTKALFALKESGLTDGNKKLLLDNNFQTFKGKYVSPLLSVLTKSEDYLKMKEGSLYEGDNFLNYVKYFGDFIMSFDYKKEGIIDQDIHDLFDNASGVINGIKTNNYANFLFDFMGILKYSFKKDFENTESKESQDAKDIWRGYKFFNLMDEFGGFSSNIINAKTSEDVNNVLKKYVKQNNSYTISRNHRFTVSLASHPGLVWGVEKDYCRDTTLNKTNLGTYKQVSGLSMPVSMKFTCRPDKIFKYTWFGRQFGSFTAMFNPVDLGSLVNYRWKSELPSPLSADNQQKAKASDILTRHFNSGLAFGISLKSLPVNVEFVIQRSYARQGFTFDANRVEYTKQRLIRISYDINLLHIYKSKK